MTEYTIFTDIYITKSRKVHVVCTEAYAEHFWHNTISAALNQIADAGASETYLADDDGRFLIKFERVKAADSDPFPKPSEEH